MTPPMNEDIKRLVEAAQNLQTFRKLHSANPTRDIAYAVSRASDFLDQALASLTTKETDHG